MPLSIEKKDYLKRIFNCTNSDISNYEHGRIDKIGTKKRKIIELFNEGELMDTREFVPLNPLALKGKRPEKYLVLRGLRLR